MISIWQLEVEPVIKFEQLQLNPPPLTLDEGTRVLPGGGYTTFRTFHKYQVLKLADHFERLEETARLAGHAIKLDRPAVNSALRQAISVYPYDEARIRISIDFTQSPGAIFIMLEALKVPGPFEYQMGVKVVTRWLHRQNPKAKLTDFIETAAEVRKDIPAGMNEVLMISEDQRVLEGLSSNFFAVSKGIIYTADQEVLSGITRSLVIKFIEEEKIPLKLEGIPFDQLTGLDEAFVTSTSRAVLPVTEIDGKKVGKGVPSSITQKIMAGYWAKIEQELETIS